MEIVSIIIWWCLCLQLKPFNANCCHMGTAIEYPVPDRVKPPFVIFDIRRLWRQWPRVLYSCTHMATVGVKELSSCTGTATRSSCCSNRRCDLRCDCCTCLCVLFSSVQRRNPGGAEHLWTDGVRRPTTQRPAHVTHIPRCLPGQPVLLLPSARFAWPASQAHLRRPRPLQRRRSVSIIHSVTR